MNSALFVVTERRGAMNYAIKKTANSPPSKVYVDKLKSCFSEETTRDEESPPHQPTGSEEHHGRLKRMTSALCTVNERLQNRIDSLSTVDVQLNFTEDRRTN